MEADTTIIVNNSGASQEYEISSLDFLVENVMLDPDGWILKEVSYSTVGISDINADKISIGRAYPNPFNSGVTMDYFIDPNIGDINVKIDILDINGRAVETLINSRINSGFNKITWNSNNAAGIYFLQLVAEDFISTQKIIHLK